MQVILVLCQFLHVIWFVGMETELDLFFPLLGSWPTPASIDGAAEHAGSFLGLGGL